MDVFIVLFLVTSVSVKADEEFKISGLFFGCERDVTGEYHQALQDFSTKLFKQVAKNNNDHFVMSQYSVWLALSGIAESSAGETRNRLLKTLNLPQDSCLREKYYEIATSLESAGLGINGSDVTLSRKRILAIDNSVNLNTTWARSVRALGLIEAQAVLFENSTNLKNIINIQNLSLNLSGNSIVLDSLDYEGLWTTAFDNATIESEDFFNDNGVNIGRIEMLKVKKRVKLAHLPLLNAKLLELPVGINGRYRMLFILNLGRNSIKKTIEHFPNSFIVDSMPFLIESLVPLEVAIPRFKMTSELDLRTALEGIGLDFIWKEANATKYISTTPTQLSTIAQRVRVTLERDGLFPTETPPLPTVSSVVTGLASVIGRGFIANRPFLYGLVDAQTRTCLFAGTFSKLN